MLRALHEHVKLRALIEIVAINELGNIEVEANLLKYNSVHGRFSEAVTYSADQLHIDRQSIR